jgi:serralysin
VNSFGRKLLQVADNVGDNSAFNDVVIAGLDPLPRTAPAAAPDDDDFFPQANLVTADSSGATAVNAGALSPVATIAQLADYLVNGFWAFNHTIAHHWASNTISYNIDGLNSAEQFLAQSALNAWHEVANVSFVRTSGAANITFNHSGTMTAVTNAGWNGLGQISSATVDISADWITNDGGARDGKTGIDSYGYQTYIHEIGHALGLGHQGPYNGSAVYGTNAIFADDTWQYSIMSYFSQGNYSGSTSRYVITPQTADIYAIDSVYGAAVTRGGDTVYGFHNTAGSIFDFSAYSPAPALTIYDSGGNDTLDCSGYSVAQTIDLHAGSFSSVGGLIHNIGIATNTNIENAIGGGGNDTLIANDFGCTLTGGGGNDTLIGGASNDRLVGGSGMDVMTGGGGADVFVFTPGDSLALTGLHDWISDFQSGVDHIDLTGMDAIITTGVTDAFRFIGASAFDGTAGELDYSFDGSRGVTVVQGDTNGDRVADFAIDLAGNIALGNNDFYGTTPSAIVIEAFGSTSLTAVGNNYFLTSGGAGPSLKFAGAPVTAGQFAPYTPVAVEQTSSGYQVAWQNSGTDQFSIWSTDLNGTVYTYYVVPGHSAALESLEPFFHQDLNGDGVVGVVTAIEAAGSTSLTAGGNNFYLFSGGTGPSLKYAGAAVAAGQFAPYAPIGAEQIAGGYEVAWKNPGADLYSTWITDSNGNFVSYSVASGSSVALQSEENIFHQDLNGDGVIGLVTGAIEVSGTTSLTELGNNFYLGSGGTGPALKYAGAAVTPAEFAPYTPVGAEQTSGGYQVAWKDSGADQFSIWSTDLGGNFTSYSVVSGHSVALESLEPGFQQDLNGDGVVGVATGAATVVAEPSFNFAFNAGAGVANPIAGVITNAIANAAGASGFDPAQWTAPHLVSQPAATGGADPDHHGVMPLPDLHPVDLHAGGFIIN